MTYNFIKPVLRVADLKVGDRIETATRTIIDSDVRIFCGLVGDTNPTHLSDVTAKENDWEDVLVPATLTCTMAIAMFSGTRWLHAILMPFIGMTDMRVERPVFPGDTISANVTVTGIRLTSDKKRYVLELKMEVFAEAVAKGSSQRVREKRRVMSFAPQFMLQDREIKENA